MIPLLMFFITACGGDITITEKFLASETSTAEIFYISEHDSVSVAMTLPRGSIVQTIDDETVRISNTVYQQIQYNDSILFVKPSSLVDIRANAVLEKHMFVRTPASIVDDEVSSHIATLAQKAAKVEIIGYDSLYEDGTVKAYRVRYNRKEGRLYAKYLLRDSLEASKNYMAEKYDSIHKKVKNSFGGGDAIGCDFYPREKPAFKDNVMPEACYSLYLNISTSVIGNIEEFIALAKSTKINTFVIDIKDNECPGYKADAMLKYSPTNHMRAGNNEALYKKAVQRLHEEGFYAVGRITCFKDTYFVKDHPEVAITEKATGKPFFHNKAYWPSAYDRKVWQFNVELAKEAVRKFGFNEINFDYVRFPDRMTRVENLIDYHNTYKESKVQAIQRFVQYAVDELHALGAYVSVDVFGESANPGYTTAYGQYWPALSNVADVICGMPYPDHFSDHYYGIDKPWNHPYELLYAWGKRVQDRQAVTPSRAKVRTWVQAYHVMRHVDKNGIDYDGENIAKEIRGLYDADCIHGYCTWLASSNINKYRTQVSAFSIDYLSEWKAKREKK